MGLFHLNGGSRINGLVLLLLLLYIPWSMESYNIFDQEYDKLDQKYGKFSEEMRLESLDQVRAMFSWGYESYMKYAFPLDELDPIHCKGRGPDHDNPSNININDVLGDYTLTLVDSLDTLAVMGNVTEFQRAIKLVIEHVSFDKENTVQVFEANIRLLGGLLSAHMLIEENRYLFGEDLRPKWYDGELLYLASDLASRLLPAFQQSSTGIPYPRVNLRRGIVDEGAETCTAGAGSLLLELGALSRLLGDPIYEASARRANRALWSARAKNTGLLGNVINVKTGQWVGRLSGLGAGLDSYFEYLLKSYILFGEEEDYITFNESYNVIKQYLRRGRPFCNSGFGEHPLYVNVDMHSGNTYTYWIDSLQASFPAVQVLIGDVEEAICGHAWYYNIWKRYGLLPERFNWQRLSPDVSFYPLRPELVESTYLLYQATKNPFYLHVGREVIQSINAYAKTNCGYATVHDVHDMSLEDRMESFFLSETCKYLYLLFDTNNPLNKHFSKFVFTTEGHLLPIGSKLRTKPWDHPQFPSSSSSIHKPSSFNDAGPSLKASLRVNNSCSDKKLDTVDMKMCTSVQKFCGENSVCIRVGQRVGCEEGKSCGDCTQTTSESYACACPCGTSGHPEIGCIVESTENCSKDKADCTEGPIDSKSCPSVDEARHYFLPLRTPYYLQLTDSLGLKEF